MTDIEKQQFQNQSGGFVGAVVIGPKGEERGIAVEPDGYVWLSEQEQRLTANAPLSPQHTPCVKQTRQRRDEETDALVDYEVTPLVPMSDERFVPADARPVPGVQAAGASGGHVAQQAATAPQPSVPISEDVARNPLNREAELADLSDDEIQPHAVVPTPSQRAAEAAAAAEAEAAAQEPPPAPQEPPVTPPTPPVEEHAAVSPGPQAEEVGAALPPTGEAPQGEYARAEEVGTPVEGSGESAVPPEGPPPPWSPGSDAESQPPADQG